MTCKIPTTVIPNCELYAEKSTVYGCAKCKWGFRGILGVDKFLS
jgi:hypothetical protein